MNMDDRATNRQTGEEMTFRERLGSGSAVPVRAPAGAPITHYAKDVKDVPAGAPSFQSMLLERRDR